jgi:predicted choloylglycine hydrolase
VKRINYLIFILVISQFQLSTGQEIIAGSENDFMIVHHYKIKGTNREVGREIAHIAKTLKIGIRSSEDSIRNELQYRYLKQNYPQHFERMKGISDEYGIELNDHSRDLSFLPYFPVRTECSVVFYPRNSTQNGHNVLSRNSDMPVNDNSDPENKALHMCSRPIIFEVYPDTGYSSIYICSIDLFGGVIDGMNSKGLSVALMGDGEYTDCFQPEPSSEVGINELLILRYLLDNCKNVSEAKESFLWLKQYYSFGPMHYLIADNEGHSFVFEFSRYRNQSHIIDGNGIQCVTNHFLYEPDTVKLSAESRERLNIIKSLTQAKKLFSLNDIKEINSKVSPWMPDYRPQWRTSRTLWYSIYDLDSKTLTVKFYLGEIKDPNDKNRIITRYSDYVKFELEH